MKSIIPNTLTLFNLFFGCIAIVFMFRGAYQFVWICAFIAGVGDALDGMVARWLKVDSELGKQLDSLSDVVASGVLPGIILFILLEESLLKHFGQSSGANHELLTFLAFPAFFVPAFAALRLAKFNLDEGQSDHFVGMPTPAGMVFVIGLLMVIKTNSFGLADILSHPAILYFFIIAISYLFISKIHVFNIKFKGRKWEGNELKISYLALCLFLITWGILSGEWIGVPLGIVIYILISVFMHFFPKKQKLI